MSERKKKILAYVGKLAVIIAGSIISAYGITLAINGGFGCAVIAVLWQGIKKLTGLSTGTASLLVAALMIVFSFFYDRRQIHIGTVIYQIVYAVFMDIFSKAVFYTASKWINFIIMLLGIVIFSFGLALYSSADLGRGAYEAVVFSIAEKNKFQIRYVKLVSDGIIVLAGWLMGGKVGICTVVTVLACGPLLQWFLKIINKILWKKNQLQEGLLA